MQNFTPVASTLGGVLIGLSATAMLMLNEHITGISGILSGILRTPCRARLRGAPSFSPASSSAARSPRGSRPLNRRDASALRDRNPRRTSRSA